MQQYFQLTIVGYGARSVRVGMACLLWLGMLSVSMEQIVREQCVYCEKTVRGKNCSLTLSPIDWKSIEQTVGEQFFPQLFFHSNHIVP